eukprot:1858578-Rhodomonas_salina.1
MCALMIKQCSYCPPASLTQTESLKPAVLNPWSLNQRLSVRWSALPLLGVQFEVLCCCYGDDDASSRSVGNWGEGVFEIPAFSHSVPHYHESDLATVLTASPAFQLQPKFKHILHRLCKIPGLKHCPNTEVSSLEVLKGKFPGKSMSLVKPHSGSTDHCCDSLRLTRGNLRQMSSHRRGAQN